MSPSPSSRDASVTDASLTEPIPLPILENILLSKLPSSPSFEKFEAIEPFFPFLMDCFDEVERLRDQIRRTSERILRRAESGSKGSSLRKEELAVLRTLSGPLENHKLRSDKYFISSVLWKRQHILHLLESTPPRFDEASSFIERYFTEPSVQEYNNLGDPQPERESAHLRGFSKKLNDVMSKLRKGKRSKDLEDYRERRLLVRDFVAKYLKIVKEKWSDLEKIRFRGEWEGQEKLDTKLDNISREEVDEWLEAFRETVTAPTKVTSTPSKLIHAKNSAELSAGPSSIHRPKTATPMKTTSKQNRLKENAPTTSKTILKDRSHSAKERTVVEADAKGKRKEEVPMPSKQGYNDRSDSGGKKHRVVEDDVKGKRKEGVPSLPAVPRRTGDTDKIRTERGIVAVSHPQTSVKPNRKGKENELAGPLATIASTSRLPRDSKSVDWAGPSEQSLFFVNSDDGLVNEGDGEGEDGEDTLGIAMFIKEMSKKEGRGEEGEEDDGEEGEEGEDQIFVISPARSTDRKRRKRTFPEFSQDGEGGMHQSSRLFKTGTRRESEDGVRTTRLAPASPVVVDPWSVKSPKRRETVDIGKGKADGPKVKALDATTKKSEVKTRETTERWEGSQWPSISGPEIASSHARPRLSDGFSTTPKIVLVPNSQEDSEDVEGQPEGGAGVDRVFDEGYGQSPKRNVDQVEEDVEPLETKRQKREGRQEMALGQLMENLLKLVTARDDPSHARDTIHAIPEPTLSTSAPRLPVPPSILPSEKRSPDVTDRDAAGLRPVNSSTQSLATARSETRALNEADPNAQHPTNGPRMPPAELQSNGLTLDILRKINSFIPADNLTQPTRSFADPAFLIKTGKVALPPVRQLQPQGPFQHQVQQTPQTQLQGMTGEIRADQSSGSSSRMPTGPSTLITQKATEGRAGDESSTASGEHRGANYPQVQGSEGLVTSSISISSIRALEPNVGAQQRVALQDGCDGDAEGPATKRVRLTTGNPSEPEVSESRSVPKASTVLISKPIENAQTLLTTSYPPRANTATIPTGSSVQPKAGLESIEQQEGRARAAKSSSAKPTERAPSPHQPNPKQISQIPRKVIPAAHSGKPGRTSLPPNSSVEQPNGRDGRIGRQAFPSIEWSVLAAKDGLDTKPVQSDQSTNRDRHPFAAPLGNPPAPPPPLAKQATSSDADPKVPMSSDESVKMYVTPSGMPTTYQVAPPRPTLEPVHSSGDTPPRSSAFSATQTDSILGLPRPFHPASQQTGLPISQPTRPKTPLQLSAETDSSSQVTDWGRERPPPPSTERLGLQTQTQAVQASQDGTSGGSSLSYQTVSTASEDRARAAPPQTIAQQSLPTPPPMADREEEGPSSSPSTDQQMDRTDESFQTSNPNPNPRRPLTPPPSSRRVSKPTSAAHLDPSSSPTKVFGFSISASQQDESPNLFMDDDGDGLTAEELIGQVWNDDDTKVPSPKRISNRRQ